MASCRVPSTKLAQRSFAAPRRDPMLVDNPIALDDLPAEPGTRIVRAAQADAWQDGYTFLAAVRETASKVDENARNTYAVASEKGYAEGRDAGAFEASRLVRDT